MQLVNIICAAALLSNKVFAHPQNLEKKGFQSDHKRWELHHGGHKKQGQHGHHHHHHESAALSSHGEPANSSAQAAASSLITTTPLGAPTLTTIYGSAAETSSTIYYHHHHHNSSTTNLGISNAASSTASLSSPSSSWSYDLSSACPANITSLITITAIVTANLTSTSYVNTGTVASTGFAISSSFSGVYTNSTRVSPTSSNSSVLNMTATANRTVAATTLKTILAAATSSIYSNASATTLGSGGSTNKNPSSTISSIAIITSSFTSPIISSSLSIPTIVISANGTSVIVSATPVSTATGSGTALHPNATVIATITLIGTSGAAPTGTPNPAAVHCGIHGLPVGDYFLAQFVEDKADVPVTLEGCYEFCVGVYGYDQGCVAYEFYPEEVTLEPRCNLYGGSVALSLGTVDNYVPNVWYDLACGNSF